MRSAFLRAIVLASIAVPGFAQEPEDDDLGLTPAPRTGVAVQEIPVMDPLADRIREFARPLFGRVMRDENIPGAVFVFVKDGEIRLAEGFGYADLETKRPVDPKTTLFRVASVTKLVTATLVMQQVEQGRLSLDADVNRYLTAFKVPEAFGKPITLRNLLTHTAGFDDLFYHAVVAPGDPGETMGSYLARRLPPRVIAPGTVISYSNHGYGLAGYLAALAAGKPFAELAQERIFAPLGMTSSRISLPDPPPPGLAVGYGEDLWGDLRPLGYDRLLTPPAGDLVTTGPDMGRFMLMHLGNGVYNGATIISPETAALMHATAFRNAMGLDGWTLGFEENTRNNWRAIQHSGSWRGFCADLYLVPEANTGFFFATNKECSPAIIDVLEKELVDFLYPMRDAPQEEGEGGRIAADAVEGTYWPNRRMRSDYMLVHALTTQVQVSGDGGGGLRVVGRKRTMTFAPAANGPWFDRAHWKHLAPLVDASGKVAAIAVDAVVYDRAPVYRRLWFTAALAGLSFLLALWAVVRFAFIPASSKPGRFTGLATGSAIAAFWAIFAVEFATANPFALMVATPIPLLIAFAIPVLLVPLVPACFGFMLRHGAGTGERLGLLAAALGGALAVALAILWNALLFAL